jgi:putative SOS response-associated peptidase YedK
MCGRYVIKEAVSELKERYGAVPDGIFELKPSYNAAPSQHLPVVIGQNDSRIIAMMRWGLIPFWADNPNTGYSMINARAETLSEKRSFSKPFKSRRCIVPANGFYEWKKTSSGKIPHYITTPDGDLMSFAGIYEIWKGRDGEQIPSFTIITTDANETIKELHDRMPAMLLPEEIGTWLNPDNHNIDLLRDLLHPWPNDGIHYYRVSTEVNNIRNTGSHLIEPYRDLFK